MRWSNVGFGEMLEKQPKIRSVGFLGRFARIAAAEVGFEELIVDVDTRSG